MRKIISLLVGVLVIATVLPAFSNSVSAEEVVPNDLSELNITDNLTIIESEDDRLIYETIEDGVFYRYEEITVDNVVKTSKYQLGENEPKLVEQFETNIEVGDTSVSLEVEDQLEGTLEETTVEISTPDTDTALPTPKVFASSTNTWVHSKGTRMSYYLYSNGGGKARYSTMEKKLSSYNSYFNTFTRKVDSLKGLEVGTLKSVVGLGALEAAIKVFKNGLTLANALNFLKQFGKAFSVIGLGYALIDYVSNYNSAVNAWNKIPGSYYRW